MIYQVYYLDLETSDYHIYEVEANDYQQAVDSFDKFIRDPFIVQIEVVGLKDSEEFYKDILPVKEF